MRRATITTPEAELFARQAIARYAPRDTGSECSVWTGSLNIQSRPIMWFPKPLYSMALAPRQMYAYRARWHVEVGPIDGRMDLCHRCDNPSCVRLSHLFLGSMAQNVRDMLDKDRAAFEHYPLDVKLKAIAEWRSGKWSSRRALARHMRIPHRTVSGWLKDPCRAFPEVDAYRRTTTGQPEVAIAGQGALFQ